MKCMNCGSDIPDTDKFCGQCGCRVDNIKKENSENKYDKQDRGKHSRNTDKKYGSKPGYDIMTVMSTAIAFLILAVVASIVFVLVVRRNTNDADAISNIAQNEEPVIDTSDNLPDNEPYTVAQADIDIPDETPSIGTLTIISDVNIRDNPDTDNSNVIKVAKASETYEYLGLAGEGHWYIIFLEDGTKGYVSKKYVTTD